MEYSARTRSYIDALARYGDNFDYGKWLRDVRAAEAKAAKELEQGDGPENGQTPSPSSISAAPPQNRGGCIAAHSHNDPPFEITARSRDADVIEDLEEVCVAWGDLQKMRQRTAIYRYLNSVFLLLRMYRCGGGMGRLMRCAQVMAKGEAEELSDEVLEPYAVVLRATSDGELDRKAVSKYSRVLRYAELHIGERSLKKFITRRGGLNACAAQFAEKRRKAKPRSAR
jgi:hypothetical protein